MALVICEDIKIREEINKWTAGFRNRESWFAINFQQENIKFTHPKQVCQYYVTANPEIRVSTEYSQKLSMYL